VVNFLQFVTKSVGEADTIDAVKALALPVD
jgi:hypothetical protein